MPWTPLPDPPRGAVPKVQRRAKFLVDESLGAEVAKVLHEQELNVEFAREANLLGRDDSEVFAYAKRKGRVLLTHDTDFLDLRRFPLRQSPGVGVLPGANGNEQVMIRAIVRVIWMAPFAHFWEHSAIEVSADGVLKHTSLDETGALVCERYRFGRQQAEVWRDD